MSLAGFDDPLKDARCPSQARCAFTLSGGTSFGAVDEGGSGGIITQEIGRALHSQPTIDSAQCAASPCYLIQEKAPSFLGAELT